MEWKVPRKISYALKIFSQVLDWVGDKDLASMSSRTQEIMIDMSSKGVKNLSGISDGKE